MRFELQNCMYNTDSTFSTKYITGPYSGGCRSIFVGVVQQLYRFFYISGHFLFIELYVDQQKAVSHMPKKLYL